MSKIIIGKSTYTDIMDKIHETDRGIACCGKPLKIVMHIDGTDFYEYSYQCECGNSINVHTKRDSEEEIW